MAYFARHAEQPRLSVSATPRRVVVVAVLAAAVAAAFAGTAEAKPAPPWDIAQGSGTAQSTGSPFTFTFDARSGITGENAIGTMTYVEAAMNVTTTAAVRCLEVTGNRALVAGIITDSTIEPPSTGAIGQYLYFVVEDTGDEGGLDLLTPAFGGGPGSCAIETWNPQPELSPILSGEIVVQDCTALNRNGKRCADRL